MNPFLWRSNTWTKKITEMKVQKKEYKLGRFLNLLALRMVGGKDDIVLSSWSREEQEEFKLFEQVAEEEAEEVDTISDVPKRCSMYEEKEDDAEDGDDAEKKLTQAEEIAKARFEEADDKEGVEETFRKSYIGRKMIKLDQIQLSPQIETEMPVNQDRVDFLVSEMLIQFDPSQSVLTVMPVSDRYNYASAGPGDVYEMVHGRARLLAYKKLQAAGKLHKLTGLTKGEVCCWIMKRSCPGLQVLGLQRGNKIAAEVTQSSKQDLLFMAEAMLQSGMDLGSVEETVKRYCRISGIRSQHLNVILGILKFSTSKRALLLNVMRKYESYQTKDADKERGRSQKMLKGEKKDLPVRMFLQLKSVPEEHVTALCEAVLDNKVSLKESLAEVVAEGERYAVLLKIAQIKMTSVAAIRERFGEELTKEVLNNYTGAKLGKELNTRGKALKKLVKRMVDGENVEERREITMVECPSDMDEIKFEDTVVITVSDGDIAANDLPAFLARVLKQRPTATIVIVSEEAKVIENSKIQLKSLKRTDVKNVYFINDKPYGKNGMIRNLVHGLVVGAVLQEPLTECAGNYSRCIPLLVEQLTRPADRVTNVFMSRKVPAILLKPSPQVNYVVSGVEGVWSPHARRQVEALLNKKGPEEEMVEEVLIQTVPDDSKRTKPEGKRLKEDSEQDDSEQGESSRKRPKQVKQEATSDREDLSGSDDESSNEEVNGMSRSISRSYSGSRSRFRSKNRSRSRSRSSKSNASKSRSRSRTPEEDPSLPDIEDNDNTIDSMTSDEKTPEPPIKRYVEPDIEDIDNTVDSMTTYEKTQEPPIKRYLKPSSTGGVEMEATNDNIVQN